MHVLVVPFDDFSDNFLEILPFFVFLKLKFLELGSVIKHLLRVGVSLLFQSLLVLIIEIADLILHFLLSVSLVLH